MAPLDVANASVGSSTDAAASLRDVRSASQERHYSKGPVCPFRAMTEHHQLDPSRRKSDMIRSGKFQAHGLSTESPVPRSDRPCSCVRREAVRGQSVLSGTL